MGSMHTGLEEEKDGFRKLAKFYATRASGGVGLIVTGGISPDFFGRLTPGAAKMTSQRDVQNHRMITDAVHEQGGKICMQILHAGRYAYQPISFAPSRIKAPITPFTPFAMPSWMVKRTIRNFIRAAELAAQAGYDGVEVMGSEGYLINQFLVTHTNQRTDEWGGSFENRMRFPLEIVKGIREKVGRNFIIIYRLSMLDLIKDGQTPQEIVTLGKAIEAAGASLINTGIGWHEARIPTIAQMVPRAAFTWVTKNIKKELRIPVITTNRINMPEVAEAVLRDGEADMVSMARPFLADPDFVNKAKQGASHEINTCIACNQACLDHIFNRKVATCLVNPFACRETEWPQWNHVTVKNVAVLGAGPAGLSAALILGRRGHHVTLFEQGEEIGGQLRLASQVSGKEEFRETLRYYQVMLAKYNVHIKTSTTFQIDDATAFDEIVYAAGVIPKKIDIEGSQLPHVVTYDRLLSGSVVPGKNIVVIGAGGIGIDTAMFLIKGSEPETKHEFLNRWKVDETWTQRGGLSKDKAAAFLTRNITILQRSKGKPGKHLGKTTAWIHREELKILGVKFFDELQYERITPDGIEIQRNGEHVMIPADQIVICAGQTSNTAMLENLKATGKPVHVIGGALRAGELDAKRAIEEGMRIGFAI